MEKTSCEKEADRQTERNGGTIKKLIRLIGSKERETLSKFERSKILHKLTGR
jgi:hypothetical protein